MVDLLAVELANHLLIQELLRSKLADLDCETWTVADAAITARRIKNRPGVLRDAITIAYEVELPGRNGFVLDLRAAWRHGRLHDPVAIHVVVTYDDLDFRHDSLEAVRDAVNDWLRTV